MIPGSSDVFVGAFIAGLAMNMPITETLKVATGCSASKVMQQDSSSFDLEAIWKTQESSKYYTIGGEIICYTKKNVKI